MDADQPLGCLAAHRVGDGGALVAALGDVAGVAEAAHQLRPRLRDAAGVPADLGRLGGEAVPGDGRQHEVERVLGASAVRGRVGQRADGLEQLDDRAGPAVRHDQRQRVLVPRLHVDEVDVHPVDLGLELRQRVQSRLAPAPVVIGRPVAGELLDRRQLHALRPIGDQLPGGPARRGDAPPKVGDRFFGHVDPEGTDFSFVGHKSVSTSLDWLTTTDGWTGRLRHEVPGQWRPPAPAELAVRPQDSGSGGRVAPVTCLVCTLVCVGQQLGVD